MIIEIEINKEKLFDFLQNIRNEDRQELEILFGEKYVFEFFQICLNEKIETYFLTDENGIPLAIGGVCDFNDEKQKIGQVWLLCTKFALKNKVSLFKYIKAKIENFKTKFEILFNYIYKSNYKALLWLSLFGFKNVELANNDFKFFYYKKEGVEFDIRRFTC